MAWAANNTKAFPAWRGIGDLVTTCNSPMSRNFTVGYRRQRKLAQILGGLHEVAEVIPICIVKNVPVCDVRAPLPDWLYKVR